MNNLIYKIDKYHSKIRDISENKLFDEQLSQYIELQSKYLNKLKDGVYNQSGGVDLDKIGVFIDKGLEDYATTKNNLAQQIAQAQAQYYIMHQRNIRITDAPQESEELIKLQDEIKCLKDDLT